MDTGLTHCEMELLGCVFIGIRHNTEIKLWFYIQLLHGRAEFWVLVEGKIFQRLLFFSLLDKRSHNMVCTHNDDQSYWFNNYYKLFKLSENWMNQTHHGSAVFHQVDSDDSQKGSKTQLGVQRARTETVSFQRRTTLLTTTYNNNLERRRCERVCGGWLGLTMIPG